ncbi:MULTISPECIES: MerR family transcriptional regulator [unclassified Nonomuraea]|uniref:MerR family transcriptional regulator n=1 Tax=unclassified Nonomuraea TaxID=2593643 RepID=UPI0033DD88CF
MNAKEYTVGVVADLAGVSVRTLHHYDEIGLLKPQDRSTAGYRLYSADDMRRLQRILFYRELDFDLDTVAVILADPAISDADRLHDQRRLLAERIARHQAMVAVIDKELKARKIGIALTPEERLEVFGSTRLEDNADRAEQQWGDSELWPQRQQRTSQYSAEDWREIRAEQSGIHLRLLEAMRAGTPATDPATMDLAEEHRLHVDRRFHDCDYDTHRALAKAYLANERIGLNFDDVAPGLSRYIHDAILANADRANAGHA